MSNRLTSSSTKSGPAWVLVFPVLFTVLTACRVFVPLPDTPPLIPEEAHAFYQTLPSPEALPWIQAASLLIVILFSGLLLGTLPPPKAPRASKMLAHGLGQAIPVIALAHLLPDALGPQPLFPAWALGLPAVMLVLISREGSSRFLAAPAGLLSGLALSLHPFTMIALIPCLGWLVVAAARDPKTQGLGLGLWLLGTVLGLLPVWLGKTPLTWGFEPALSMEGLKLALVLIKDTFTWGALPLLVIALLAGGLQRQSVLLGMMCPILLMETLLAATRTDWLADELFFLLLPVAWFMSYGIFRVCRGIEQGVRNLNRKKANAAPTAFLWTTLVLYGVWTLYQLY